MKPVILRILSEALAVCSGATAVEGKHLRRCGNGTVIFRNLSLGCQLGRKSQGRSQKKELSEKKLVCTVELYVCRVVGRDLKGVLRVMSTIRNDGER